MVEHRKKLMTYEQWKVLYKKYVKKLIRQKVINFLYWVVMIAISVGLPFGMFVHWLFIGY